MNYDFGFYKSFDHFSKNIELKLFAVCVMGTIIWVRKYVIYFNFNLYN